MSCSCGHVQQNVLVFMWSVTWSNAQLIDVLCGRELNLVRDECTEPVVRENLELQERLVGHEQTRAELEDRLAASRSEVCSITNPDA